MREGKIDESGTFTELMDKNGTFAELCREYLEEDQDEEEEEEENQGKPGENQTRAASARPSTAAIKDPEG